jgi:hypothetical protein
MGEKPAILGEPPLGAYEMLPCGRFKRWGPWAGPPTRVVSRPAGGAHRPQLPGVGLVWAWPCLNTGPFLVLTGFEMVLGLHLVHLSLNRRSDIFYDFMSGQSVLATCILAQKYNLQFLEGEVWFRDFIG